MCMIKRILLLMLFPTIRYGCSCPHRSSGRSDSSSIGGAHCISATGLDVLRLERPVCNLIESGITNNTKKVYNTAISLFLSFCWRLQLFPVPALEDTLLLFIAELSQTKAYNTVHTYLACVRHFHVISGQANPIDKALHVQLAFRGCNTPNCLSQIQDFLLCLIFFALSRQFYCTYLTTIATFCFVFFGFLRSGEFLLSLSSAFNPEIHLTPTNIAVDDVTTPTLIRVF